MGALHDNISRFLHNLRALVTLLASTAAVIPPVKMFGKHFVDRLGDFVRVTKLFVPTHQRAKVSQVPQICISISNHTLTAQRTMH
jgi:hypothetical protein